MTISTVLVYLKGLIATVMSLLMMISPAFSSAAEPFTAERPDELVASFAVVSDIHVETNNAQTVKNLNGVLNGIKAGQNLDATVYTGDNVMNGQILENVFFYTAVKSVMHNEKNYVITGNHDLGNGEGDYNKFRTNFIVNNNLYLGNNISELYYYRVVNGCYMIFLSSEDLCVGDYVISDAQMEWLEGVLEEAKAANAPILVFNHHPIYLIRDRDYRSLAWLLQKYDNLLYFHGHYHNELDAENFYEWHGVDCINLPRATEGTDFEPGDGVVVEVYENEILVKGRDFIKGEWIDGLRYSY
ncbi:MAG: metallophosphoesterase [Clostridia bacterium]|nr:metallophosphoesterase [Clostridia bacterium]